MTHGNPEPINTGATSSPAPRMEDALRRFSLTGRWRGRWRKFRTTLVWYAFTQIAAGSKRLFDLGVAWTVVLALVPVWLLAGALAQAGKLRLGRTLRAGRWCEPFAELSFTSETPGLQRLLGWFGIARLPVFFNVIKGEMSLIGPRPVAPEEVSPRERQARRRFEVRPGLICLWWVRQRTNIDYGTETESDLEYVETHSLRGDLGIAARAVPSLLYGAGGNTARLDRLSVLGLRVDNLTMTEAIETILTWAEGKTSRQISFVNPHCANLACGDAVYKTALNESDLVLADGIGMKIAGKILAREIRQNVNGTDLFPRLCAALAGSPHGLYLLGGRPGVTDAVADWLARNYPETRLCGHRNGYFTADEEPEIIRDIAASGASVLLVAFGVPKQDVWLHRHLTKLNLPVAMGVGGLFDFYSGRIPRAPQWLREIGFEWAYRLYQEPGRMWKRYIVGNLTFVLRVVWERVFGWK
ncbi:MAG: WecB/TagA/CpsF family glycosyltransferase [Blastocatellia bacterium]|nr:WecB/TagA/CpsF family glycosyltransferase [Blastocatellia bacterium]